MSRVNWAAKSSHEYVANYKLLQNAFNKQKIQKHVDVDKLIRGKYQDNLEFCQWLKAFFDQTSPMMSGGREGYDPVAVRAKGKGGKTVGKGVKKATSSASSRMAGSRSSRTGGTTGGGTSRTTATTRTSNSSSRPTSSSTSSRTQKENKANASSSSSSASRSLPVNPRKTSVTAASASSATKSKYEEEIRSLKSENTTLKAKYATLEHGAAEVEVRLQTVESERDFYFEKLRGIEVMLQVYKEKEDEEAGSGNVTKLMDSMFKVMYATMEDNVEIDESGNVSTYPNKGCIHIFCFFVHMHHGII